MAIRTTIKNIIDSVTHPFGIDIVRYFGSDLGLKEVHKLFSANGINLILDVGANTGQYATSIIKTGYKNSIVSFEPLSGVYEKLKKNAGGYSNWQVYERCAIGDHCGKTMINVSKNSHSSSILPVSDLHITAAPSAESITTEEISIYTLDSIADNIINNGDKICLKIDTQGFEDKVLAGAVLTLKHIDIIQIELSLMELYRGSKTIEWMILYLKELNFEPVMYLPGFIDRTTEQIQQLEGLFRKIK